MIHQHRLLYFAEGVEVGADVSDGVHRERLGVAGISRGRTRRNDGEIASSEANR
jgi:hypothetical protein